MDIGELVGRATGVAAESAVAQVRLGELTTLGDVERYISTALDRFFAKHGPGIAEKLAAYTEPATKKAVEIIKPSVEQALKDYTPTFAAIAGGMLALSVLLGVWVSKRSYQYYTGRRAVRRNPGCPICPASWRKLSIHVRKVHARVA